MNPPSLLLLAAALILDLSYGAHPTDNSIFAAWMANEPCQGSFQAFYMNNPTYDICNLGECDGGLHLTHLDLASVDCQMANMDGPWELPLLTSMVLDPYSAYRWSDRFAPEIYRFSYVEFRGNEGYLVLQDPSGMAFHNLNVVPDVRISYSALANLTLCNLYVSEMDSKVYCEYRPGELRITNNPYLTRIDGLGSVLVQYQDSLTPDGLWRYPYPTFDFSHNPLTIDLNTIHFPFNGDPQEMGVKLFFSHTNITASPWWQPYIYWLDLSFSQVEVPPETVDCISQGSMRKFCIFELEGIGMSGELPEIPDIDGAFIALNLENNNLYGTIPSSWTVNNKIVNLNLRNNRLSGELPSFEVASESELYSPGIGDLAPYYYQALPDQSFFVIQQTGAGFYPYNAPDHLSWIPHQDFDDYAFFTDFKSQCMGENPDAPESTICNGHGTCITDLEVASGQRCCCDFGFSGRWCESTYEY